MTLLTENSHRTSEGCIIEKVTYLLLDVTQKASYFKYTWLVNAWEKKRRKIKCEG